jgi:hypothetical protein
MSKAAYVVKNHIDRGEIEITILGSAITVQRCDAAARRIANPLKAKLKARNVNETAETRVYEVA